MNTSTIHGLKVHAAVTTELPSENKMTVTELLALMGNLDCRLDDQRNEDDRVDMYHLNWKITPYQRMFAGVFILSTGEFKLADGYSRVSAIQKGKLIADGSSTVILNVYTVRNPKEAGELYDSFDSKNALKKPKDEEVTAKKCSGFEPKNPVLKNTTINAVKSAASLVHGTDRKDHRACYQALITVLKDLDKNFTEYKVTTANIVADIKYACLVLVSRDTTASELARLLVGINKGEGAVSGNLKMKVLIQGLELFKARGVCGRARAKATLELFEDYLDITE